MMLSLPVAAALVPADLRCDGQTGSPATGAKPQLSWRSESPDRGQAQSAWQVLVASSAEMLAQDNGDLWDSGKVAAQRSPLVTYAGRALAVGQVCHWKVRCWDRDGQPSAWSKPASWELAPSMPTDWQGARWIDDGRPNPTRDEDFYQPDPAPLLRREFAIAKPVVRARLHVAGLGYCLTSLNGARLADQALDPPWTAFDKRILFRTHDVTAQLTQGANCLGLTLGNGWFNPLPLRMWGGKNFREALPLGRPRVIACLVAEHPDGTHTTLTTGPDWTTTAGPTVRNSIYLGEERDARLTLPGWDRAGFDAAQWRPVRVTDDSLAPLQPLAMLPVRAEAAIPAVAVTTLKPGVHIVDFGRNFTGVPEIDLNVPAGTKITFRFGELLNPDGTLNPLTSVCGQIKGTRKQPDGSEISIGGPGAPPIAWQQDVFIARGGGAECYRPDFTYHGFRFMEVTGLPETPVSTAFRGIPLHTELPSTGSFACSNEQLNRIQEMCRRTFLANVVTVQSDCPHRERFGYGGDIVATSEAFLMNFDMGGFYAKTVRDWADAARPDGRFTDTSPFVGIDYCGVGWAMAHPLLLDQLYQNYGNRSLLEEQLPAAIRWLDGEAGRRKQGLVAKGLSDHEALAKVGGPVLTTPMFIDTARRIARLARVMERGEDAKRFESMADESSVAWASAFLDTATGKVAGGSQSEQAFALGYGAAPQAARPQVFKQLLDQTKSPDGPRLSTGIFGTQILLDELSLNGRGEVAYALANRKTFPSWGWMLENDATTLWEHWAGSDNTFSHSHPMFGSISAWFFRWLGGIQLADDAVGFDRVTIRPQPVGDLKWVKCSHQSIRGLIESNWSVTANGVDYEIVIPPDTTAIIELPVKSGHQLTESGKPIGEAAGIKVIPTGGSVHCLEVGSGRYLFKTEKVATSSNIKAHSQGLHGYIGFGHEAHPPQSAYHAGMGFYAAVWPLTSEPLAGFQIGLPSSWIQPDNSDNKDKPLAPEGTLARTWKPRGPTWSSVFQTVEGGLGYWARNHFRYGPPKFSMNATPQCYDYEVGSPGWSFFYSNEALPDHQLGIAQLSNHLLIPPDGLTFQGNPNGEFLGYTWMALPFTEPTLGDPPTGDQSWTCFLSASNFKGPIAYYIPETWSKIGKLFNEPFLHGRGLDARPGIMGGGAMEINTVPCFDSKDSQGTTFSKLPKLQFPVDAEGRAFLVQDVTYYSKEALYDAFKSWRDGGPACSGEIGAKGAWKPKLNTHTTRYTQADKKIAGVEKIFDTRIFEGNVWGLQWSPEDTDEKGKFPQYYKQVGDERVPIPAAAVPAETQLLTREFKHAGDGAPYTSPSIGAWASPGPKVGPFKAKLVDGSVVTYSWYRFVDQPSFQQYQWTAEKKAKLQALVEKLHANWTSDRNYMPPPTRGTLVALDPALRVTPPKGLEVGYVPIVTGQKME